MSDSSVVATDRATGLDLLAATTAFLLPVAYLPIVDAPFWSPKVAVLLPAAAVGLTCIPSLLRTGLRRATLAALAFLVAASISTALSDDVSQAVFGLYNAGTGLIFIFCLVGVWALGASVTDAGRRRIVLGLVAGIGISAAVGVAQVVVDLGVPILGSLVGSRSSGLAGNPVHLAALSSGIVAMAAVRSAERRWWLVPVAAGAGVLQLAGSRFALLLLPLLVLGMFLWRGWRVVTPVVVCVLLGLGVAANLPSTRGSGTASTERLTLPASGGGITVRLETWLSARHPIADQPLFGVGPGRFRAATSPHRTLEVALIEGPDVLYEDAHNLGVEYATTTGIVGLLALAAWLGLAATRTGYAPLGAFAAALLALHLVQPQSVATTPFALLALGAATRVSVSQELRLSRLPTAAAAAASLGVVAALLVGDFQLQQARLDFDDVASRRSVQLLAPWPNPATVRARLFLFEALQDPGGPAGVEALRWRHEAISRAPDSPDLWNRLAEDELASGLTEPAQTSFRRALDLDPWSRRALRGIASIAGESPMAAEAGRSLRALERS